jgi:hypothetical protein
VTSEARFGGDGVSEAIPEPAHPMIEVVGLSPGLRAELLISKLGAEF